METPLETAEDDFSGQDGKSIGAELERRREQAQTHEIAPKAETMLDAAAEVEKAYTDAIQQTDNDPMMDNLPWEVRDKVKSCLLYTSMVGAVEQTASSLMSMISRKRSLSNFGS